MTKLVNVTKAGGAYLEAEKDVTISINPDNITRCEPILNGEVGTTKIYFKDGATISVTESLEELEKIVNS